MKGQFINKIEYKNASKNTFVIGFESLKSFREEIR